MSPELNELLSELSGIPGSFSAFSRMIMDEVVGNTERPRLVHWFRQCWVL